MECPSPKCKKKLQVRYYENRTAYFCTCGYLKVNYKKNAAWHKDCIFNINETILSNQEQS